MRRFRLVVLARSDSKVNAMQEVNGEHFFPLSKQVPGLWPLILSSFQGVIKQLRQDWEGSSTIFGRS